MTPPHDLDVPQEQAHDSGAPWAFPGKGTQMGGERGLLVVGPHRTIRPRRRSLNSLCLVLLALPSCTGGLEPPDRRAIQTPDPTPDPGPPNVLIFLTDDQRADTLEVMPATIRWFAKSGTQFTQAHVTTPLCCPSRASILTGRYVHNHGVRDNFSAIDLAQRTTLEHYLRTAGYRTAIAGKFLNEWDLSVDPPFFDRWAIFRDHLSYRDVVFNVDGDIRLVGGYSTSFVERQALGFLRDFEHVDGRPWFLIVSPLAPHKPFTPERQYADEPTPPWPLSPAVLEQDLSDKPPFLHRELGPRGAKITRRLQLRTLMSTDDAVDAVMTEAERLGELQDTLAFFLSDNGFLTGEHGLVDKRLPYTESTHIPLYLRWDGHTIAGGTDDRLVANVDVAPTVLAAVGVAPPLRLDGHDLLGPKERDHLFLEYFLDPVRPVPEWAAVLTDDTLYVEYSAIDGSVLFREYYDNRADPWQTQNLLGDDDPANDPPPAEVRRLSNTIGDDRHCQGVSGPTSCP
jgi:arylsulfatase A-like enzyme